MGHEPDARADGEARTDPAHSQSEDKRQVIRAEKGQKICDRFQNEALSSILGSLTARLTPEESRLLVQLLIKMLPDEATKPHR
jgi:MarR family multiple antibiotic resistance transcriptional regulator